MVLGSTAGGVGLGVRMLPFADPGASGPSIMFVLARVSGWRHVLLAFGGDMCKGAEAVVLVCGKGSEGRRRASW